MLANFDEFAVQVILSKLLEKLHSSQGAEVLQELQTSLLTLFRMKLDPPDIVFSDNRGKKVAILCLPQHSFWIIGPQVVGVHKVEVATVTQSLKQQIGLTDLDLVPADLWNFELMLKTADFSSDPS